MFKVSIEFYKFEISFILYHAKTISLHAIFECWWYFEVFESSCQLPYHACHLLRPCSYHTGVRQSHRDSQPQSRNATRQVCSVQWYTQICVRDNFVPTLYTKVRLISQMVESFYVVCFIFAIRISNVRSYTNFFSMRWKITDIIYYT